MQGRGIVVFMGSAESLWLKPYVCVKKSFLMYKLSIQNSISKKNGGLEPINKRS